MKIKISTVMVYIKSFVYDESINQFALRVIPVFSEDSEIKVLWEVDDDHFSRAHTVLAHAVKERTPVIIDVYARLQDREIKDYQVGDILPVTSQILDYLISKE